MLTDKDQENQEAHIKYLRSEMQVGYADLDPERWAAQRGYIATCEYPDLSGAGTWTDGVDFVVLDDNNIAFRLGGDWRPNGDWCIGGPDDFVAVVVADAKEWLEAWQAVMA